MRVTTRSGNHRWRPLRSRRRSGSAGAARPGVSPGRARTLHGHSSWLAAAEVRQARTTRLDLGERRQRGLSPSAAAGFGAAASSCCGAGRPARTSRPLGRPTQTAWRQCAPTVAVSLARYPPRCDDRWRTGWPVQAPCAAVALCDTSGRDRRDPTLPVVDSIDVNDHISSGVCPWLRTPTCGSRAWGSRNRAVIKTSSRSLLSAELISMIGSGRSAP